MLKNNLLKKNIIWNFLGLSINAFNSLFFLIIVNRINGANDGGIFSFAYSLICLLYFIATFYNRTFQISNEDKKISDKDFIITRVISCLLMIFITILLLDILKYKTYKSIIILSICIFRALEAFADVFYGIEQKNGKLYLSGQSMFIKGVMGIALFFVVDLISNNMLIALISLSIVNLMMIIFYDIPNSKKYISNEFDIKNILKIYRKTIPIFIFSFLNIYLINCSKYTLDFYETAQIQNVFGIILMPGTILSLCSQYILNPYLMDLTNNIKNKDYSKFKGKIKKLFLIIIFLGIICEVVAFYLGIPILNIIYGIDLTPYKVHLLLVILGSIFLALTAILSSALTIIKKNYIQMIIYIYNSIIAILLSIYLIKRLSIFGAVLNYLIVMIFQFISFYIFYKINMSKLKKE